MQWANTRRLAQSAETSVATRRTQARGQGEAVSEEWLAWWDADGHRHVVLFPLWGYLVLGLLIIGVAWWRMTK